MGDRLEKTDIAQQGHDLVTGEIPITIGGHRIMTDPDEPSVRVINSAVDMFTDDTPLACGIENPDICESCT